ncbi:hypothetical protein [Aurantiacibacter hainanensis]|uniref:hypothetical protein n=1 Tax=Aurantiacibacter hainanensis TaxID=3076114 RepID=UPI0030C716F4
MALDAEKAYGEIYQLLDELRFADCLPVGSLGRMFAAVDALRAASAPSQDVSIAGRISVAMLRWERSRRRDASHGEEAFRAQLAELTSEWLETRLPNPAARRMMQPAAMSLTSQPG